MVLHYSLHARRGYLFWKFSHQHPLPRFRHGQVMKQFFSKGIVKVIIGMSIQERAWSSFFHVAHRFKKEVSRSANDRAALDLKSIPPAARILHVFISDFFLYQPLQFAFICYGFVWLHRTIKYNIN